MTTELVIAPDQTEFTDRQVTALKALGIEDAPRGDVDLLFHQSVRTGLDPFLKQIYLIGRDERKQINGRWETVGKKWSIQTGIDGFRVIRDRKFDAAGEPAYQGQIEQWCGPDGVWRDVWLDEQPPAAARIFLFLRGREKPIPAVALWREYAATDKNGNPQAMWKKMPAGQLMKCAEALALRKAFPQDLSGVYVDAEMDQADITPDGSHVITKVKPPRSIGQAHEGGAQVTDHEVADMWIQRVTDAESLTVLDRMFKDAKEAKALTLRDAEDHTVQQWFNRRHTELEQDAQSDPPPPVDDGVLVPDYQDETPF